MDAEDIDVRAVQLGHPLRRQDLVGRSCRPPAVDDEQDVVDEIEDGVDVVGHEQDRPARLSLPAADQLGDLLLVMEVEVRQRLVAQQELGFTDQRLGDPQALLFAAGQPADG